MRNACCRRGGWHAPFYFGNTWCRRSIFDRSESAPPNKKVRGMTGEKPRPRRSVASTGNSTTPFACQTTKPCPFTDRSQHARRNRPVQGVPPNRMAPSAFRSLAPAQKPCWATRYRPNDQCAECGDDGIKEYYGGIDAYIGRKRKPPRVGPD